MGRVEIKAGFWIVAALWLLLFPARLTAGVFLAAAVHEMGHLLALGLSGVRVDGLVLDAGGARIVTGPMEAKEEFLCALAGPVAGCAVLLHPVFPEAAVAAAVQTSFNLLPVYPLDGGRVLGAGKRMVRERRI